MSGDSKGPQLPGWAGIVVVAVLVLVLAVAGYRVYKGDGPRDPSTYPKEAYRAPGYTPSQGSQAPARTTGPGSQQNPYSGAYSPGASGSGR